VHATGVCQEERDVAVVQRTPFGWYGSGHARRRVGEEPQPVEVEVAIHRVAQEVRMEALFEQNGIRPRGPEDDADVIAGERGERPVRSQELYTIRQ
jgi:hypothetical protein